MEMRMFEDSGQSTGAAIADYSTWANQATRSLELLRAIERTVAALSSTRDLMRAIHAGMTAFVEGLPKITGKIPEQRVLPAIELAEDSVKSLHEHMKACKASADSDTDLTPDDGVSDAYADAMSALVDAHEAMEELRWGIMHHNAALDASAPGPLLRDPATIEKLLLEL